MTLRLTTKILIGAIVIALAVLAIGHWRVEVALARLTAAVAACERKAGPDPKPTVQDHLAARARGWFPCVSWSSTDSPINLWQAGVEVAQDEVRWSNEFFPKLAAWIAGVGGIPWLWYFLLRRLAEVGKALKGNTPER